MLFKTDFITRNGHIYQIETDKLDVLTTDGRRTILSNHMPIMLPLAMGVIETNHLGNLGYFVLRAGVLYFEDNRAYVLASDVISLNSLNVYSLRSSKKRYENTLAKISDESQKKHYMADIAWLDCQLKAVERYGKKKVS